MVNQQCGDPYWMSISFFDGRREQECQAQRPLWGQVQVSPASFVTELNAVVGVALEAADDDDAIFLTIFGTLVWQQGA